MPAAVRAFPSVNSPLPSEQDGKGESWFESANAANTLNILWSLSVSLFVPVMYFDETISDMRSLTLSFHAIVLATASSNNPPSPLPPKDENYANLGRSKEYKLVSQQCSLFLADLNKPSL